MNETTGRKDEMEALERLLASHGADRTRWPAPARLRFANLIAADAEAGRLVREAAALDSLLDMAPDPGRASDALAARIAAAAAAEQGKVIDLRARSRARPASGGGSARRFPEVRPAAAMAAVPWPAAALMAASLLIGAFAGTAGVLSPALQPLTAAVSDAGEFDADASQIAFGFDDALLFGDDSEDTL